MSEMKSVPSSDELWRGKRHLSKSQINSWVGGTAAYAASPSYRGWRKMPHPAFMSILDEAEAKEGPQLQLRRCQNKAIGILKTRR